MSIVRNTPWPTVFILIVNVPPSVTLSHSSNMADLMTYQPKWYTHCFAYTGIKLSMLLSILLRSKRSCLARISRQTNNNSWRLPFGDFLISCLLSRQGFFPGSLCPLPPTHILFAYTRRLRLAHDSDVLLCHSNEVFASTLMSVGILRILKCHINMKHIISVRLSTAASPRIICLASRFRWIFRVHPLATRSHMVGCQSNVVLYNVQPLSECRSMRQSGRLKYKHTHGHKWKCQW